ncbi:MAG: hypothetical protein ACOYMS_03620 [Terrimicrobiaceae bacterium]
MVFLTRREQMLVACVLVAFATGLGVRQWRAVQPLVPLSAEGRP